LSSSAIERKVLAARVDVGATKKAEATETSKRRFIKSFMVTDVDGK
jgi:hypothetical protein